MAAQPLHCFLTLPPRIARSIRRRSFVAGFGVALLLAVAVHFAGGLPVRPPATPAARSSSAEAARPARSATGASAAVESLDAVEVRAVRFGEAVQRRELDAAIELWAKLPAAMQEPTWRSLVASWLQANPADARHLAEIARTARCDDAFAAVIATWAELPESGLSASSSLAEYSQQLPPGPERRAALEAAVRVGTQRDPASVAAWLPSLRDTDELDSAAAYLVAHTDVLFRPTSLALEWAALIRDPARRGEALASVVREWHAREPAAARTFVARSENFSPEQRTALLASLTQRPDPQ